LPERPRILVLTRRFLGDTVLAGPVFGSLRAWRPEALIVAGAFAEPHALALHPEIDRTILVPRKVHGFRTRMKRWRTLVRELRESPWDLVYDMAQTDRSALVTLLAPSPLRVGFAQRERLQRHRAYHHVSVWTEDDFSRLHSRDLYLKALEEVGVPVTDRTVCARVSPDEANAARARIQQVLPFGDRPLLMVHPGAGAPSKCWPPSGFAAVCDAVQSAGLAQVLLLGGPVEARAIAEIQAAARARIPVLTGALDARTLAAVLQAGDLLFCHDSGPMHVAAAVGTPVVALFGASSPTQWGPLGAGHAVLRPPMPCLQSCLFPKVCKFPNAYLTHCVLRLSVEEVADAVLGALRASRGASPAADALSRFLAPGHQ
jgi:heptosyltransferase-3